jgi:pre-mRNA-processing factor 39
MVPSSNPSLALTLAMIEEERGDNEAARRQYQKTLENCKSPFIRFANINVCLILKLKSNTPPFIY